MYPWYEIKRKIKISQKSQPLRRRNQEAGSNPEQKKKELENRI